MSYTEFSALVAALMQDYFANSNSTVYPDHFEIPQSDWNGMAVAINPQFWAAGGTQLDALRQAFVQVTGNPNFKIYPCAYGDAANNKAYINIGTGKYRYCLYRKDEESMVMDVPLNLTQLAPNTSNNFVWNGVAFGQFTGVQVIRVPEVRYYDHS